MSSWITSAGCAMVGYPSNLYTRPAQLALLIILSAIAFPATAANPKSPRHCASSAKVKLWVTVEDLRDARGEVAITLYGTEKEKFMRSGGRLDRQRLDSIAPSIRTCFALPTPGRYAVIAYHDIDDDSDFDRDPIGRPSEPFGFSNNPRTRFGIPALKDVLFEVTEGNNQIEIRLKR